MEFSTFFILSDRAVKTRRIGHGLWDTLFFFSFLFLDVMIFLFFCSCIARSAAFYHLHIIYILHLFFIIYQLQLIIYHLFIYKKINIYFIHQNPFYLLYDLSSTFVSLVFIKIFVEATVNSALLFFLLVLM